MTPGGRQCHRLYLLGLAYLPGGNGSSHPLQFPPWEEVHGLLYFSLILSPLTCLTIWARTWDSSRVESLKFPTLGSISNGTPFLAAFYLNWRYSEPFLWHMTAFLENITVFFLNSEPMSRSELLSKKYYFLTCSWVWPVWQRQCLPCKPAAQQWAQTWQRQWQRQACNTQQLLSKWAQTWCSLWMISGQVSDPIFQQGCFLLEWFLFHMLLPELSLQRHSGHTQGSRPAHSGQKSHGSRTLLILLYRYWLLLLVL